MERGGGERGIEERPLEGLSHGEARPESARRICPDQDPGRR